MVRGRSRVPLPPARRIAFMTNPDSTVECSDPRWTAPHESAQQLDGRADVPRTAAGGRPAHGIRNAADPGHAEGTRRGRHLRAGLADRLARRLPGPAPA